MFAAPLRGMTSSGDSRRTAFERGLVEADSGRVTTNQIIALLADGAAVRIRFLESPAEG